MTDSLNPIPDAVLSRVKWALGAIAQFNDAIRCDRLRESVVKPAVLKCEP